MISKKDLIIAVLATFCLTSTLFLMFPTRSETPVGTYDPWIDTNDDGSINILDSIILGNHFLTFGTPINKTELLLELLTMINSMNTTIADLQSRILTLENNSNILPEPAYDTGWAALSIGYNWFTHNLNTTEVVVYMIGNGTGSSPHPPNAAIHQAGFGGVITWGAYWTGLNETDVCIYRTAQDTEWPIARLMIWRKQGFPPPPLPYDWYNGLVGYWKLDEGTGNVTMDSSGHNNNGTLQYGPTWVSGKYASALSFDGIDDYVTIQDSASLRVQSFSIVAWVYMTVRPYQAGHPGHPHVCIVNKLHFYNSPAIAGYKLDFEYPTATDDTLVISIGDGVGQRFLVGYNSINDLTLNQWHQIVGTYDGSTAKIYIDSQLKATGQGSYTILHDETPLCFSREITQPVYDGLNGIIDNVMIYNRTLSTEEVLLHYLLPPP